MNIVERMPVIGPEIVPRRTIPGEWSGFGNGVCKVFITQGMHGAELWGFVHITSNGEGRGAAGIVPRGTRSDFESLTPSMLAKWGEPT
jgi:hypothetical protein